MLWQQVVRRALDDMVWQGTVLGCILWNTFFGDVMVPASSYHCEPVAFADDLTVFKSFDRSTPDEYIEQQLHRTRAKVHKWGGANRVEFDPCKESVQILHPLLGGDVVFRLLGVMFDSKFSMKDYINQLVKRCLPKMKAILR